MMETPLSCHLEPLPGKHRDCGETNQKQKKQFPTPPIKQNWRKRNKSMILLYDPIINLFW